MAVLESSVSAGLERYQRYRTNRPGPLTQRQIVEQQRQQLVSVHQREVGRYQRRLENLRRRQIVWTSGAAGAGTIGLVEVAGSSSGVGWFTAAALSGVFAFLARDKRSHLQPPAPPQLPDLPIDPLPAQAPGADHVRRWARAAARMEDLLPPVDQIHPEAGGEIRSALVEVDPALRALVQRLGTLYRTAQSMPGTQAAVVSQRASGQVAERLGEGVDAYEGLVAAAAALIGAPDLRRSVTEVLDPAVLAVEAYTEGMRTAADVFGSDGRQ